MKGKYIYILVTFHSSFAWATPFEKHEDLMLHLNNEIGDISKRIFNRTKHPAQVSIWNGNATVRSYNDDVNYRFIVYRKKIK